MRRVLAIASVLVALLTFSALEARADGGDCEGAVDPKHGRCGAPATPPPEGCSVVNPDGECGESRFAPTTHICTMCGNWLFGCPASVWWGGAFGSWLLVLGVMLAGMAWPLWRRRKDRPLVMDERQRQEEISAMIRARRDVWEEP